MDIQYLRNWVRLKIDAYPQHAEEIRDLFQLCLDEIEDGESPDNEIQLCMQSVTELVKS